VFALFRWNADAIVVDVDLYIFANQLRVDRNTLAGVFEGIAQQVAQGVGHRLAVKIDEQVFWQFSGIDDHLKLTAQQADRVDFVA